MENWDDASAWLHSVNSMVPRFADLEEEFKELEAGQVWRARWDDVVSMVYVDRKIGTFRNLVRVAPITVGSEMADDLTVVLPSEATSLSVSLSIWTELSTDIAEVVLERWITNVDRYSSLEALRGAADEGVLQWGIPILNESGRRAKERRELALIMEALASAVHLISGNGSLPDMISAAGLAVVALGDALGVKLSDALMVSKGTAPVDVLQARVLAPLLGTDVETVLAGNPVVEDGLVEAVTPLAVRSDLLRLEMVIGANDSGALRDLTKGSLALAARQEGVDTRWKARVDLYFAMKLGERI